MIKIFLVAFLSGSNPRNKIRYPKIFQRSEKISNPGIEIPSSEKSQNPKNLLMTIKREQKTLILGATPNFNLTNSKKSPSELYLLNLSLLKYNFSVNFPDSNYFLKS